MYLSDPSRSRPSRTAFASAALRLAWRVLLPLSILFTVSIAAQEKSAAPSETPEAQEPVLPDTTADTIFQVVVNAENPTTELPAGKVAKMFLKQLKRWDHGVRVLPIDLEAKSEIRKAFTKSVQSKSITAIKSFWQRMIFSGRGVPPLEESTEEAVLEFVRANPGAIGYVATEMTLGNDVKKLKVTP